MTLFQSGKEAQVALATLKMHKDSFAEFRWLCQAIRTLPNLTTSQLIDLAASCSHAMPLSPGPCSILFSGDIILQSPSFVVPLPGPNDLQHISYTKSKISVAPCQLLDHQYTNCKLIKKIGETGSLMSWHSSAIMTPSYILSHHLGTLLSSSTFTLSHLASNCC